MTTEQHTIKKVCENCAHFVLRYGYPINTSGFDIEINCYRTNNIIICPKQHTCVLFEYACEINPKKEN